LAFWRNKPQATVVAHVVTPAPASWWKVNRHLVLLAVGFAAGIWVTIHVAHQAPAPCTPAVAPSRTAAPSHSTAAHHRP